MKNADASLALDKRDIVDEKAAVVSVERRPGRTLSALLLSPKIARRAKPMQFVLVKVRAGNDPFLRRPFCLSLIDASLGLIRITWDVVGQGTAIMAGWEPGQDVLVLGPLGNGFVPGGAIGNAPAASLNPAPGPGPGMTSQTTSRRLFLLAGGTGLAPMLPLSAAARATGWEVSLFYGARTEDLLMDTSEFRGLGCSVSIATDDGSKGIAGFVTSIARPSLSAARPLDIAVACGPRAMMRAAKEMCQETGTQLYLSLEERMACGTGLCRGCAVKAATSGSTPEDSGPKGERYLHVCLEGPVFRAEDIEIGGEE